MALAECRADRPRPAAVDVPAQAGRLPSAVDAGTRRRVRLRIEGIVQGVGFRPFAYSLATRLGIAGFAANDSRGVVVEAEGESGRVARFVEALVGEPPPLAVIEHVGSEAIPPRGEITFAIVASDAGGERRVPISADVATCADCLREVFDASDRRFGYAFTNCTNCGPRFTVVTDVPYDRPYTTMAAFEMCGDCAREYADPANRRFHAQPLCCPACGPRLVFAHPGGALVAGDAIDNAVAALRAGAVVAIKGLGGYHLAVPAADESAVARLRRRKHRDDKPFAVMVASLDGARDIAEVGAAEERLLASPRRPIVLLRRLAGADVAASLAPGNRCLGLMLPYTALHHLLLARLGAALVLTSGNVSDEPIAYRDADAFARLAGIADAFLTHDRAIHIRTDDSVLRVFRGREMPLRRARGYAPQPLWLPRRAARPILACGAELKSTFCLVKGDRAFLSHHIGDLENFQTLTAFREGIEHYRRLFDVEPEIVAHDLHPEYLSTKLALEREGVEHLGVQHHHAHVAACLADNGEAGPVIGVALDGLGYGVDGTLWGGEFLVADLAGFERVGHLEPVPLPGGTQAIRQPWRMAAAYLDAAYGEEIPSWLGVVQRHRDSWEVILRLARSGVQSPQTSSAGRLFDAVAALVGIRDVIRYEGQAAIELEQIADANEVGAYGASVGRGAVLRVRGADLIAAVVDDLGSGAAPGIVAARFHNGLAAAVVEVCEAVRASRGLSTVALSGGVFQNMLLLRRVLDLLEERDFRVLVHSRVPANDGGISFGQAAIAAARSNDEEGRSHR